MKKYALIGYPLGHSLSPQIHERLFAMYGEKGSYEKIEIAPENLSAESENLSSFTGFNVTIPHKVSIIDYCDRLDDSAARFGAVNCVRNGEEKVGYNTDVIGFTRSIAMMGAALKSKVLLIGCGGAGRMMAIETALEGGEITIAALSDCKELVGKIVDEIKEKKADAKVSEVYFDDKLDVSCFGEMPEFDLILNATPVGMFPKTDNMPCTKEILEHTKYVFDAVYNPKETLLVKTARELGKTGMNGMAMLVLQAAAAHEIWNGASFDEKELQILISDMEALI